MSDDILRHLESLKHKIEERKAQRNQVDAEVKWNMQKLKELFDCDCLEEANGLLVEMLSEADATQKELAEKYNALLLNAQQKGLI